MNSTGRELSQADLIRNFILMGLEPELQTRLYEEFWRPMELVSGRKGIGLGDRERAISSCSEALRQEKLPC